jgi:hypothetical protein
MILRRQAKSIMSCRGGLSPVPLGLSIFLFELGQNSLPGSTSKISFWANRKAFEPNAHPNIERK